MIKRILVLAITMAVALSMTAGPVFGGNYDHGKDHKGKDHKVTICHKGKKTISVDKHALKAHKKHGDEIGKCKDKKDKAKKGKKGKKAYICHATGSKNNPYVLIKPSKTSAHFDKEKHPHDVEPVEKNGKLTCPDGKKDKDKKHYKK